jgi:hypothetical protein
MEDALQSFPAAKTNCHLFDCTLNQLARSVTDFCMRMSVIELAEKRLGWSAGMGDDQTESPANRNAETGYRARVAYQRPEPGQTVPEWFDPCATQRQDAGVGVPFAEYRLTPPIVLVRHAPPARRLSARAAYEPDLSADQSACLLGGSGLAS